MNRVRTGSLTFMAPGAWDELSMRQLISICQAMLQVRIPEQHVKGLVVWALLDIRLWQFRRLHWFFSLSRAELVDLFALQEFIWKENRLTRTLIRSFRLGFKRYYGPTDGHYSMTWKEFTLADGALQKYHQTKKEEFIDMMIAILYREKDRSRSPKDALWNGDCRLPFNRNTVEKRAKKFARLKPKVKMAIMTQFRGARNLQEMNHPSVFIKSKAGEQPVKTTAWGPITIALAGDKFGTLQQTEASNWIDVLHEMEERAKQAEAQERRINEIKSNKGKKR